MDQKEKKKASISTEIPFPSTKESSRFSGIASRVMKIKRRHSRYERPIYALWELFSDYSEISTVHGVIRLFFITFLFCVHLTTNANYFILIPFRSSVIWVRKSAIGLKDCGGSLRF